ncbi:hypothetical protein BH09BAC3_BH09BAC3_19470 [soil metagenome]
MPTNHVYGRDTLPLTINIQYFLLPIFRRRTEKPNSFQLLTELQRQSMSIRPGITQALGRLNIVALFFMNQKGRIVAVQVLSAKSDFSNVGISSCDARVKFQKLAVSIIPRRK